MASASRQELEFILKMQDQASSQLKAFIDALGITGNGAKEAKKNTETFGQSLDKLVEQSKKAAVAVAGVWTSNQLARRAVSDFAQFERALVNVGRTTGQSRGQLKTFSTGLDNLRQRLKIVDSGDLLHL